MKLLTCFYLVAFLDMLSVGLFAPLFSTHLRTIGFTHFQIGLLQSLYSGIQVISSPLFGSWSDIRGRKSVLQISLIFTVVCYPLIGLSQSFFSLIMLRTILGLTKHVQNLNRAIISDKLPASKRFGVYGTAAAYSSVAFIIGPLIGGHLMEELKDGFFYICIITSLIYGAIFYLITITDIPTITATNVDAPLATRVLSEAKVTAVSLYSMNWAQYWDKFTIRFLYGFSVTIFFSNQSIYLKENFFLSQHQIGYIVSYFSIAGAVSAFLVEPVHLMMYPNDDSCYYRLIHFFLLQTCTFLILAVATDFKLVLVGLTMLAICSTILKLVSMELFLQHVSTEHRGSVSGAANSIMSIARFVTPIPTGFFNDYFGTRTVVAMAMIPSLIGAYMCYQRMDPSRGVFFPRKNSSEDFSQGNSTTGLSGTDSIDNTENNLRSHTAIDEIENQQVENSLQ